MISAREANNQTIQNRNNDREARHQAVVNFVETVCQEAVKKAIDERKLRAVVEVAPGLSESDVAKELEKYGYVIKLTLGEPARVSFEWTNAR